MITGSLKRDIDKLWTEFWTGGITNPLTVIEQITFLMFARSLDIAESRDEKRAQRTGKPFAHRFGENEQHLRWGQFRHLEPERMLKLVRDEVLPHFKKLAGAKADEAETERTFAWLMRDAQLLIQKPSLLQKAVDMIDDLPLTLGDRKGDLYEYLLSKLTTAGINGQFRTPRHVIDLMVAMVDPKPTDTVADPACGTGGFLVQIMEHLRRAHTSPTGILREADPDTGKELVTYTGDLLEPHREHVQRRMFHGFDFDATMLRLAAMNMMLHGVEDASIRYADTLGSGFTEAARYSVVLANPPFKGSLDPEDTNKALLARVRTKKTELLFVVLILRLLQEGGRAAVIVPDGVLFGSSGAHQDLRKLLIEENQLEAVVSLPSGVFKPYAGVSTGILVFTKGGRTDDVLFVDVRADGFSLDDKREPVPENDLPMALEVWRRWQEKGKWAAGLDRSEQAFAVSADEIHANAYDLSLSRYHEPVHEEEEHEPPRTILARMKRLEAEVQRDLDELEGLLA